MRPQQEVSIFRGNFSRDREECLANLLPFCLCSHCRTVQCPYISPVLAQGALHMCLAMVETKAT